MHHSIAWLSRQSSVRSVDSLVATFDEGWERPGGSLAEFWVRWRSRRTLVDLSALIKVDLRRRFGRGERPAASTYLSQFPELAEDGNRVLSLVYEEFCLLHSYQANPCVADFCQRYARWKDSIASQLGYHHRFSQQVAADRPQIDYPKVGERFANYLLCSVLGLGGTAQVYLATDAELGGREVVLKLTATLGLEPSILATLEHRNIVPIHSVARAEGSPLQGICMPYRPGITLEQLLFQLFASRPPRRARMIWNLLDLDHLNQDQADLVWRDFPIDGTYTEGVAWLGLEMARALAYLHGRGVYHRDVKPANILLSARGGPLLIDFNLAHSPHTPEQAREAMSGGTLPYMAPEQLQAFLDPKVWDHVGAKADIYALGLVLRELVTGVRPSLPTPGLPAELAISDLRDRRPEYAASSRDLRPDLPPSLDAVIRKCLAFNPEDRYASAQHLADDLRLFLQRKPLVGVANPSAVERGWNWAYRQRQVASTLFLMSIVLTFGLLISVFQTRPQLAGAQPQTVPFPLRLVVPLGALPVAQASNPLLRDLVPSVPIKPVVGVPYDALKDEGFLRYINILQTKPTWQWAIADQGLHMLAHKHEKSAWPLVYLLQIEMHLGKRPEILWDLIFKIEGMPDAEAASLHCLQWASNSAPLLLTVGIFATARGDYDQARHYFNRALAQNKNHPGVKLQLARVASKQGHPAEAIDLHEQVVKAIEAQNKPDELYVRKDLVHLVLQRIDELLLSPIGPGRGEELRKSGIQKMVILAESQIEALFNVINRSSDQERKSYPYLFDLSQGALASSRGWIDARDGNLRSSEREFRTARKHLDKALLQAQGIPQNFDLVKNAPTRDAIVAYIRELQRVLDLRVTACGLTDVLAQPTSSSSE